MERIRLTEESIAGIKVAKEADFIQVKGGFNVVVSNEYGEAILENATGPAVYKTKGDGKKVVERHNENVTFKAPQPALPPLSMRPPVQPAS
jgi:hypothetical protein